ncbi:hypothetical protein GCM10011492_04580 [Flexivirga endophytica]|uniref:Glycosyl-hydrolase family 116 catalytic region domain-containing protein n=1 Tax=Flexivirga endophytica TaxID=1849103 RepID=A0A916WPL8_9MICO|nr:GH116 family glycosyl-hydrolase [Flexivirga endophytica]GGB17804.1 hypothetical protein GCM10011492_04580 [Flexivirga endophytica]GHB37804.1 hypothetical protein GCM10008112_03030 [Flexivirga endophytica]
MKLSQWPVTRSYDGAQCERIAMPVGGIGTGTVSFGGRGQLLDWELFNRPAKGNDPGAFLALRTDDGERVVQRVVESTLLPGELAGSWGSGVPHSGLPRFAGGRFEAAYPFGKVRLHDPDVPLHVTVGAMNPLVPGAADDSGIPLMLLRVSLHNPGLRPVRASLCLSMPNVVGHTPGEQLPDGNVFTAEELDGATMLVGRGTRVSADAESWGTLAVATRGRPASSLRTTWAHRSWGDSLLDFWDDLSADGQLDEPLEPARVPTASLVQGDVVEPGDTVELTFAVAWHFPNRRAWTHAFAPAPRFGYGDEIVGNHYTQRYADAAEVLRVELPRMDDLERRTSEFVQLIAGSDLPGPVSDAVLSTLSVLKSTTCFRIADGTFLAWEGSNDDHGSCHGSCTHVWNYQYALEALFPDLAWSMREVELLNSMDERGMMSFRAELPLQTNGTGWRVAAADGQMGALVRLHRTWQLTGDTDHLRRLWPAARRALEFAWIADGWDADQDGVMEGCQHNTMDVEYYGPNGVGQSWYLAALGAMAQLSQVVGDDEFASRCAKVRDLGASATDGELFNGDFYEQHVLPPGDDSHIAEGLRIRHTGDNPDMGSDDLVDPDLQLGLGLAGDQLAGVTMATAGDVEHGLNPGNVRRALVGIWEHNHRDSFLGHFNHLRTFASGAERGLVNCSYPRGGRPERPSPYSNEVWTGIEYTAATGLAQVGEHAIAAQIAADVRSRYDGTARNPFNEVECGNHYVRSMAAFGMVSAWPRATIDIARGLIVTDRVPGDWPVVAGELLGTLHITKDEATYLPVRGGVLSVIVRDQEEAG